MIANEENSRIETAIDNFDRIRLGIEAISGGILPFLIQSASPQMKSSMIKPFLSSAADLEAAKPLLRAVRDWTFVSKPKREAGMITGHTIRLVFILSSFVFYVPAAQADLRLCNNTSNRVSISLAYTDGDKWISEGWWNLKASGCETLMRGPLAAEFYYVYAMDERGGEWKGKAFMCTRDHEFRITGRDNCFVRGFDRTGFFEVDTGKEAKNWTVQLTEQPQSQPAHP